MADNIDPDALHRAIDRWERGAPMDLLLNLSALKAHMIQEHGIEFGSWVGLVPHRIVDKRKYLMFILKYS